MIECVRGGVAPWNCEQRVECGELHDRPDAVTGRGPATARHAEGVRRWDWRCVGNSERIRPEIDVRNRDFMVSWEISTLMMSPRVKSWTRHTPIVKPPNCSTVAEEVGDELVLTRPRSSRFFGVVLLLILVSSTYLFVAIPLDAMGIAPLLPGILRPVERFHPRPPGKPIHLSPLPASEWLVVIPVVVGWPFLIAWTVGHLSGFDQVRIGPGGSSVSEGRSSGGVGGRSP